MRPETATDYSVERLCGHHDTASFDCGVVEWNEKLRYFQTRFEAGDRVLGFVTTDSSNVVSAYIILHETLLPVPDTDKAVRCLTVPAIGRDRAHRHEQLFEKLIERSINAMVVRQESARETGAPYRGIVCMPGKNDVLRRWLEAADFKPFPGDNELLWIELDRDEAS